MGASATQDEDIIIFNDESESEELEIVNGQEGKKSKTADKKISDPEVKIIETEELISFGTDDAVVEEKEEILIKEDETELTVKKEETIEDSPVDLVTEEVEEETQVESLSIEEQLKSLETIGEESLIIDSSDEDGQTEKQEEISLEVEAEVTEDLSAEDFKNQLIQAQEQEDGVSFEDMGIDLDKLGDSEGENLKNIEIKADALPESSLAAETAVFGGVALLGLESQEEEITTEEVSNKADMLELDNDIGAFGDLSDGMQEVDEETHNGILEAAILKLVTRKNVIDEDIIKIDTEVQAEEDSITALKKEIKEHEGIIRTKKNEKKELENEKATISKTEEGIEKMKIEESKKAA